MPSDAWDVLGGEWGYPGYGAIASELASSLDSGTPAIPPPPHRHPPSNILLLAWSAWLSGGTGLIWCLIMGSSALIVAGFTLAIGAPSALAACSAWITVTIPLLENHAALPGYTELVISVTLLACCSLIAIGLLKESVHLQALGLLLSLLLLFTKSTGLAYMATVWGGYAVIVLFSVSLKWRIMLAVLVAICVLAVSFLGFDLTPLGISLAWNPSGSVVTFAGRAQELHQADAGAILENLYSAFVLRSSFSVTASIALISVVFLVSIDPRASKHCIFLITVMLFGFALLAATQLTEYGFRHASPNHDTQNSRSTLPFVVVGIVGFMAMFNSVQQIARTE